MTRSIGHVVSTNLEKKIDNLIKSKTPNQATCNRLYDEFFRLLQTVIIRRNSETDWFDR